MKNKIINKTFIFFVIILFIFTFNITSSRYIGHLESTATDVNAIPILSLTNPTFSEIITGMLPGNTYESDFYVSNYDSSNTNEVFMEYYIQVPTQNDLEIPVKISITNKDGEEISLDSEGKTPKETLIYEYQQKTLYHIKVEWDKEDNSYEYAGKSVNLNINVVATQVVEGP